MTFDKAHAVKRINRILDAARAVSPQWAEEIQYHTGYAEPGYSDPESGVILTADWNETTRYNRETNELETTDRTPKRVAELLEKAGAELEWCDEWTTCDDCQKLVRTEPDSYGWKRSYSQHNDGILCEGCIKSDPADYLESLEGDDNRAMTLDLDLSEHDYYRVAERFEHGFHPGQDANPKLIASALREMKIDRFIFTLDSVGQFDMDFSVWIHKSQRRRFSLNRWQAAPKDGPSNSEALKRGLQAASQKMAELPDDGIKVARVNSDGTANVRTVTPEEFIEGKALDF